MVDTISFEEIRKLQNMERDNKSLQKIEEHFFEKVKEYLREKHKLISDNKHKENVFSKELVEKNEYELHNVNKILADICNRRHRKIILQALTDISARVHNTENMLAEEEELFNSLLEILKANQKNFLKNFDASAEKEPLKRDTDTLKIVRIIDEVPSFVWKDGNTYGPCKKEDVINLPEEIAELLIKQKKASGIILDNE